MKLYDNIMASNGDVTIIPNYMLSKNQFLLKGPFEQRSNVICMTIEEAYDLWSAGHKRGWGECLHGEEESGRPDFLTYLKSKGIQLINNQLNESKG